MAKRTLTPAEHARKQGLKYYPAYRNNGLANEMACDDCPTAGFGVACIVARDDIGDIVAECCLDCAVRRWPRSVDLIPEGIWPPMRRNLKARCMMHDKCHECNSTDDVVFCRILRRGANFYDAARAAFRCAKCRFDWESSGFRIVEVLS